MDFCIPTPAFGWNVQGRTYITLRDVIHSTWTQVLSEATQKVLINKQTTATAYTLSEERRRFFERYPVGLVTLQQERQVMTFNHMTKAEFKLL